MCGECAVFKRIWEEEHTHPGPRSVYIDILFEVGQLVCAHSLASLYLETGCKRLHHKIFFETPVTQ
jgi:hypothetical protein